MSENLAHYSNKQFDSSLDPLLNGLKSYFGISTKGAFVFLATFAMKFPERIDQKNFGKFNTDGAEFRDDTDDSYNTAVDILIERYCKENNLKFSDVRTDQSALENCMNYLRNKANEIGISLMNGELSEFKRGISDNQVDDFIIITASLFEDLKREAEIEPEPF